jgi:hypothetical protein
MAGTPKRASEAKPRPAVAPAAIITGPMRVVDSITAARLSPSREISST